MSVEPKKMSVEQKKLSDIYSIHKKQRNAFAQVKFAQFIEDNREDLEEQYKNLQSLSRKCKDIPQFTATIDEYCYFVYRNRRQ